MLRSFWKTLLTCWRDGHHVALGIFRFLIPIVICVKILDESGLIPWLAIPMSPIMELLDLPAEFSLVWLPCMLVSLYSGLSVLLSLAPQFPDLTVAQMTVFGVLTLIAHSLILEVRIAGQCGVSMLFQFLLRLLSGILAAYLLHVFLDSFDLLQEKAVILLRVEATPTLPEWIVQQGITLAEIYVIICLVMLLQKGLDTFQISRLVAWMLSPALRLLGISPKAVSVVIIGFTMGILYGSGILIKSVGSGEMSERDALCSISLLGLSHALIEDTLVLALLGGNLWGLLGFRVAFTLVMGAFLNLFYPVLKGIALAHSKRAAS